MINILKPDFIFEDDRGSLTQLVHSGYSQFNIVTSHPGSMRGGHYHAESKELFYVISGRLKLTAKSGNKTENFSFSSGDMFEIEKGVIHDFEYIDETILAVMYDKCIEKSDGSKDIIKE